MWTTTPLRTDIIVVKVGVLNGDALERLVPAVESFTSRKPSWVKCLDGTVQYEEGFQAKPSSPP